MSIRQDAVLQAAAVASPDAVAVEEVVAEVLDCASMVRGTTQMLRQGLIAAVISV